MNLEPHHERMITERNNVGGNLVKLVSFIQDNPAFQTLSTDEQERMTRQMNIMAAYFDVLGERLAAAGLDSLPKPIPVSTAADMVQGVGAPVFGMATLDALDRRLAEAQAKLEDVQQQFDANLIYAREMSVRDHVTLKVSLAYIGYKCDIGVPEVGQSIANSVETIIHLMGYE